MNTSNVAKVSAATASITSLSTSESQSVVAQVLRKTKKFEPLSKYLTLDNPSENVICQNVYAINWQVQDGTIPAKEAVRILLTAPDIGELTSFTWLALFVPIPKVSVAGVK